MRPNEMDLARAVQDLEENGSSQDPIFLGGEETTPEQLEYVGKLCELPGTPMAKDIKISYYGGKDLHLIKRGTLSGMVKDRRRLREATVDIQDECDDPSFSLADWRKMINRLIRKYGKNTIMTTDGGYNNVTLRLEKP